MFCKFCLFPTIIQLLIVIVLNCCSFTLIQEVIPASKDDFQAHVRKTEHIFKMQDVYTPPIQYFPEQRPFQPSSESWQIRQSQSVILLFTHICNSNHAKYLQKHFKYLQITHNHDEGTITPYILNLKPDILNSGTEQSLQEHRKTCQTSAEDSSRHDFQFLKSPQEQSKQTKGWHWFKEFIINRA